MVRQLPDSFKKEFAMRPIFALFYLFEILHLQAQTAIQYQSLSPTTIEGLWAVSASNQNSDSYQVYLEASLREQKEGEVFQARSASFLLSPGIWVVDLGQLQPVQTQLDHRENVKTDELPNGRYWFETRLIEAASGRVIGRVVAKSDIRNAADTLRFTSLKKRSRKIQSGGQGRLEYMAQAPTLPGSALPGQLVRADFQASMQAFGVPVGVNALYSSKVAGYPAANQLQFSLDKAALRQQLIRWIVEKSDSQKAFDSLDIARAKNGRAMLLNKKYPKLDDWKSRLDSTEMAEKLADARQLQNLDATLKNEALQKELAALDELKAKYDVPTEADFQAKRDSLSQEIQNRFEQLFQLKKSVARLEAQRAKIQQQTARFKKYERLYSKVKNAENADLESLIQSPEDIRASLKNLGFVNRLSMFLLQVDELDIGTAYPFFSQLTLNGAQIQGANCSFTTARNWHAGLAVGRTEKAVLPDTSLLPAHSNPLFQRFLIGGQAGYGRPEESHFYLTFLQASERQDSKMPASNQASPAENFIASASFLLTKWNDRLVFSGEWSASLLNPDRYAPVSSENPPRTNVLPVFKSKIRSGAATDNAFEFDMKAIFFDGKTELSGFLQQIGAGYQSFGLPFLMQDIRRYEARISQRFFREKVRLSAFYKQDFDQTSPLARLYRTYSTGWGTQAQVQLKKGLSIIIHYSPYYQTNTVPDSMHNYHRKGKLWQTTIQYHRRVGAATLISQAGWTHQMQRLNDSLPIFRSDLFSLTQQVAWKKWSCRLSSQMAPHQQFGSTTTSLYGFDFSISANSIFRKKGSCSLGIQHFNQKEIASRKGFYCRADWPITRHFSFDFNVQRMLLSHASLNIAQTWQTVGSGGLRVKW